MTEKTEAVQRMQEYIQSHLTEPISFAQLGEAAHYSPWHAARIFQELTGLAPAAYIRRAKLSRSALRLRDERVKIIDLAFDLGFTSVDGYQRAFRREFGCNPKDYAQNPIPLPLFTPYGVKFRQLWKKENTTLDTLQTVFLQVIEKPARQVILKRGVQADDYMAYCQEVGCDVWGMLTSFKSLTGEPVCLWLPKKYRKLGTSEYVQGVELPLDAEVEVPEGFDRIQLPPVRYLMFQGEPFPEEDYCDAIQVLQASMDKYDPALLGYQWDDETPRIQLEPIGARGYIELRPIK